VVGGSKLFKQIARFIQYIHRPPTNGLEIFIVITDSLKRFWSLHRLPNARKVYRIPREVSRNLNLLVCFLDCHARCACSQWQWCWIAWHCIPFVIASHVSGVAIQSN